MYPCQGLDNVVIRANSGDGRDGDARADGDGRPDAMGVVVLALKRVGGRMDGRVSQVPLFWEQGPQVSVLENG